MNERFDTSMQPSQLSTKPNFACKCCNSAASFSVELVVCENDPVISYVFHDSMTIEINQLETIHVRLCI